MQRSGAILVLGRRIGAELHEGPHETKVTPFRCLLHQCPSILFPSFHASAVLDEEVCEIHVSIFQCRMQRSPPLLVLGCGGGGVLDQDPSEIHFTTFRRTMKRSRPALIPGCPVGALLEKDPCEIHMALFRHTMKWSPPLGRDADESLRTACALLKKECIPYISTLFLRDMEPKKPEMRVDKNDQ